MSNGYSVQHEGKDSKVLVSGRASRKDDNTEGRADFLIIDEKNRLKKHLSVDSSGEVVVRHDWEKLPEKKKKQQRKSK